MKNPEAPACERAAAWALHPRLLGSFRRGLTGGSPLVLNHRVENLHRPEHSRACLLERLCSRTSLGKRFSNAAHTSWRETDR